MATRTILDRRAGIGPVRTLRRDLWWVQPLVTFVVLGGFVVYSTWAAFQNGNYFADPYVSPFYSPCLATSCLARTTPSVFGSWWSISPAIIVLPFPLLFRSTCYYYRKAYYRAFFLSPPACAVREPHRRYRGESRGLFLIQNIHRYGFFLVIPFCVFLTWDAINSFFFEDGFGMGLGTLILLANATLLTLYTFSCHSARHLFGGNVDEFARAPVRHWMWKRLTWLNERHMLFAWCSLIVVALADLYVRLVASGTVNDPRFF